MAILAECDICGNQHRVKDDLAGSSLRCKDCGTSFVILPGPAISAATFVEENGRLCRREEYRTHNLPARVVAGLITCVVFMMLTGMIWATITLVAPTSPRDLNTNQLTPKAGCKGESAPCKDSSTRQ